MVIPPPEKKKINGIAAVMYGWHYLHVVVVLHFFLSEDGGPSGEKLRRFSLYFCQPPAEGAPTLAPGPLCTNRLYVQGHLKSHIHMYNAT